MESFHGMDNIYSEGAKKLEEIPPVLSIVKRIEEISESVDLSPQEIVEQSKSLTGELLIHLHEDLGLELSSDVSGFYEAMQREKLLARVENVSKAIECIVAKVPISVGSSDSHYANAVISEPEGLRIAMAEADALGPVRLLIGLDLKAMVGFKSDHLEVVEIDDTQFDIRNTQIRKSFCRHVIGEILPEDMRYMILRIPRAYFPEDLLEEWEKEKPSTFIFRGTSIRDRE